jgi:PAS domain S-box-containing protein
VSANVSDGVERMLAMRTVSRIPLVVILALPTRTILAEWKERSLTQAAAFAAAALITAFLTLAARRRAREVAQAQGRIADLLEFNQGLISGSPVGIAAFEAGGECALVNEAMARILGGAVESIQAQNFMDNESWRACGLVRLAREVLETGQPVRRQLRLRSSFGREIWCEFRLSRFHGGGKPHLLLMAEDDTERKQAEEARARVLIILEAARDLVASMDQEGRLTYMNEAGRRMVGIPVDADITAYTLAGLHRAGTREFMLRKVLPVASARGFWEGENEFLTQDGRTLPVSQVVVAHPAESGGIPTYSTIARDIAERKRFEEALRAATDAAVRADRAKGHFLANMSHEIRTPLNAIIGLGHLVQQTGLDPVQSEYLRKLRQASEALLAIVNDILDFSKIEAGMMTMSQEPLCLEQVCEEVMDILGLKAEQKGLELLLRLAPGLPREVAGDAIRLKQILLNLGGNAVKFTDQGEVETAVSLLEEEAERVRLEFSVRDTGVGIDPGQMDRIFHAFSQADESATRRFGGTGLGLAISRRLVELMGGGLKVDSAPGQGSTFTFTAWFGRAGEPVCPEPTRDGAGLRVLAADDSPAARDILAATLAGLGCEVSATPDGPSLLAELARDREQGKPCHLVLLDWRMPGMDGVEAARAVLALPGGPPPAVVLMAPSYARQEVEAGTRGLGLAGVAPKPVLPGTLRELLAGLRGRAGQEPGLGESGSGPGPSGPQAAPLTRPRILLADDNSINRQVVRELLTRTGYAVDESTNGSEAVNLARGGNYAAVLMDVQMPVMDGLEATRTLTALLGPACPPILAMTGHIQPEEHQRCLEAGMSGVVTKPVEPAELFAALARWTGTPPHPAPLPEGPASPPGLPPLAGFEVASGLSRMGGNVRLYRRMLAEFRAEFQDAAVRLRTLLEDGRAKEAELLAHNLKGVSGDLGAGEISLAAANLEQALALSMPPAEPLAALALALEQAMRALGSLGTGEAPAPPPGSLPLDRAPDLALAREALIALEDLTARNHLDADRHLAPLKAALAGTVLDEPVRELEQALSSFRYAQALALVRTMRLAVEETPAHPLPDPAQTAKPNP